MQIRAQSGLRWAWAFAILWNLIAAPATLFGAAPAIRRGPGPAWVALVFPIAGAALLLWALQLTLRVRLRDRREAEWLAGAIRCSLSR